MKAHKTMKVLVSFVIALLPLFCNAQITGSIKGKVFDRATKQPVIGAIVSANGAGTGGAATDTAGFFVIDNLPDGGYFVVINYAGYQEKTLSDITVLAGKTNYLDIEIEEAQHTLKDVKITTFKYENSTISPVSAYSFSRQEISLNPGAQGDIFRAIGMLPGVSSSGGEYSAIAVRGQGVRDNVYLVDDIPVTEVGHLEGNGGFNDPNGGRFSIFAPRVIDNAQFQGGGFGPEYGRRSASYLGLGIKEGNRESPTVDGQLDLLGVTVNYDGPSGLFKNTSVFASARYQDFRAVVSVVGLKDIGLPKYGDFIFKSVTDINTKNKLSFVAIVAPESYVHGVEHIIEDKKLNNISLNDVKRNKIVLGLNLRTLVSKNSYWKNIIYYTRSKSDIIQGTTYPIADTEGHLLNTSQIPAENNLQTLAFTESKIGGRSIFTANFKNKSKLTAGIDLDEVQLKNKRVLSRADTEYVFGQNDYRPGPGQYYTVISPAFYNADFNDIAFDASAYVNYSFLLLKNLSVNAGLRYDYTGFTDQHTISPRLSGSYALNEKSSVNFAAGIYYQDPVYAEIADQPKNQKLKQERITQYIAGYKKYFTPDLKLTIEGWYKDFSDLIVRPISGYAAQNNEGTGWGAGIDANITKRLTRNLHGQVGYSYMQSKRDDHDGHGEYDFTFSQPHQANFLLSYKTNKHWILAAKFRYATGKPSNSYIIHGNVFNNPNFIRYSEEITGKNDTRLPDFMSLDVRANYLLKIRKINLNLFIDIVDVLNRQIANGNQFNPISGKTYYDGIAIFPSFGLKFEY